MSLRDYRTQRGMGFVGPFAGSPEQGQSAPEKGLVHRSPRGLDLISVTDPDHPNRIIWVEAIWDPVRDWMVPIDPKYRGPGNPYAMANIFTQNFADASSGSDTGVQDFTGAAVPAVQNSQTDSGGGVLLIVAAVLGLYLLSR